MLLGAALLFGDGLITPAISVLSATEGLGAINPNFERFALPLTVLILILIFAFQYKGTGRLGKVFGGVILLWFFTIGLLGALAMRKHPEVLQALSPAYAIDYVVHHGFETLVIMSSVILAVTGSESLFADLGHFGKKPIRIGWFFIVMPNLVLCYLGQAANAIDDPANRENLFFSLAPNATFQIYLVVLATAATIIASQALITGIQSLTRQASMLGLFPRVRIIHTSETERGQIYVPAINAILAFGSILLVINFRTSEALSDAYSLANAGVMLITTTAVSIIAWKRWKWPLPFVVAFIVILGLLDLAFFTSTLTKLIHGAWVPLLIALGVAYLLWVWRKGQNALTRALARDKHDWQWLEDGVSSGEVVETESLGIFLSSEADRVPQAVVSQVQNLQSVPHRMIIATVVTDDVPYTKREAEVHKINHRAKQVIIHTGFMEFPNVPEQLMKACLSREDESLATYYLSTRKIVNPDTGELRGNTDKIFSFLHRNSATASDYYQLPEDRVISLTVQMNL
jgi:KUP system potassium uptake protein